MNRRQLLIGASALCGLTACQPGSVTPPDVVSVLQNGTQALANTLNTVLKTAPNALPPTTASNINTYLADAASVLSGLAGGMSASVGAPIVKQVETDLNAVITAAAALPVIPPPFSIALQAAAVALPIAEAWLNTVLPQTAAAPLAQAAARQKFAAQAPGMTQDAAKAILAQYAVR